MINKDLIKRIITALILLPFVVFILLSSKKLFILLLIVVLILSTYEWFGLNKNRVSIISLAGFLIILTSISFSYFLRGNDYESIIVFLWIVFVCFFSDTGGYVMGRIIKGRKIIKISPNKTYAGMYGSLVFSIFPILIFHFFKVDVLFLNFKTIILSLSFSLVCQLGDITVSYFKRKNRVKDTGNLLPGHGGLLDRVDGLIFVIIFSGILKVYEVI